MRKYGIYLLLGVFALFLAEYLSDMVTTKYEVVMDTIPPFWFTFVSFAMSWILVMATFVKPIDIWDVTLRKFNGMFRTSLVVLVLMLIGIPPLAFPDMPVIVAYSVVLISLLYVTYQLMICILVFTIVSAIFDKYLKKDTPK